MTYLHFSGETGNYSTIVLSLGSSAVPRLGIGDDVMLVYTWGRST